MEARDGDLLQPGHILVTAPNRHLEVRDGRARLLDGAPVSRAKPAIDSLFESAAHDYGGRLVAVILTGTLHEGSAGLIAVPQAGGVAVVQDPSDAEHPEMPQGAIDAAGADHCVPLKDLPHLLVRLVRQQN